MKVYRLCLLTLFFVLVVAFSAHAQLTAELDGHINETVFLNGSFIALDCNVTVAASHENNSINITLFHNFNGSWQSVYSNYTNITAGTEVTVTFPDEQLTNNTNGSFAWGCSIQDNATAAENPLSATSSNNTIILYHNFSISNDDFLDGGYLPFQDNIHLDFFIDGPDTSFYASTQDMGNMGYNCSLNTNTTSDGSGTPLQNNGLTQSITAFNGSTQDPNFPGETFGRHEPFFLNFNLGSADDATATVTYQVNCTDPNNVTAVSDNVTFTIDMSLLNFFDPANYNFTIGGEDYEFSHGPPLFFGHDGPDSQAYTEGLDIRGIAEKDGPFIISILDIGGNAFDPDGPCGGQDPFSCTEAQGVTRTPLCSGNSSAPVRTFYSYYVDSDGNDTNGCNVTAPDMGQVLTGFDIHILANFSNTTATPEVMLCNTSNGAFNNSAHYNYSGIQAAVDDDFGCSVGTVAVKWDLDAAEQRLGLEDLIVSGLAEEERWYARTGNLSGYQDSMSEMSYYVDGQLDFIPFFPDKCFDNNDFNVSSNEYSTSEEHQDKCDAFITGDGFLDSSFFGEDCFNGRDDDDDGNIDQEDSDCSFRPDFMGTDNKAPTVISTDAEAYDIGADVFWYTNEPSLGIVIFYGSNITGRAAYNAQAGGCTASPNATVIDDPIPEQTFDDFKPFHNVPLDEVESDSLGFNLSADTTYYYRLNSTDRSNNSAISNCLKFTTESLGAVALDDEHQIHFPFDDFSNFGAEFKIDTGGGFSPFDPTSPVNLAGGKDFNLQYAPPGGSFGFVFGGVDVRGNISLNLSNKIKINTSAADPFLGIDHETWLELVQDLKVDYVDLTIPDTGEKLLKCADDGVSNCTDVTALATVVGSTGSSTTWRVGTDIGFSTLSMSNSTYTIASERNEYSCYPSCHIAINYTNNNTAIGNESQVLLKIHNSTENTLVTITEIRVLNISNGSQFVGVGGSDPGVNLSLNTSGGPLIINITVNMTEPTATRLNISVEVNGSRKPAFRPYVAAINMSAPNDTVVFTSAASESVVFNTTIYSDFDTNQSCTLGINTSETLNISTTFRGLNATQNVFVTNLSSLSAGLYQWNVSCVNDANETNLAAEDRTFTIYSDTITVTAVAPSEGVTYGNNTVSLNWSVTSDVVDISFIGYYLDGQQTATQVAFAAAGLSSPQVGNVSVNLSTGTHTVVFTANDTQGSFTNSSTVTFTVTASVDLLGANTTIVNNNPTILNVTFLNASGTTLNGVTPVTKTIELFIATNHTIDEAINQSVSFNFNGSAAVWNKTDHIYVGYNDSTAHGHVVNNQTALINTFFVINDSFTSFINDSNQYFGKAAFPLNASTADIGGTFEIWYFNDETDLTTYQNVTECSAGITVTHGLTSGLPCWNNTNNKSIDVIVPHFSIIAFTNNTLAPTLNVTTPQDANQTVSSFVPNITVSGDAVSCLYHLGNPENAATSNKTMMQSGAICLGVTEDLANGQHNITFHVLDDDANLNTYVWGYNVSDSTASDGGVVTSSVTTTTADITITGVNESVNVTINYGSDTTLGLFSFETDFNATQTDEITGLSAGTLYYFNLSLCDFNGNCFTNGTYNFTTSAASPPPPPPPSSGGGGGGGGGGGAPASTSNTVATKTQIWSHIPSGSSITMDITNSQIAITQVLVSQLTKSINDVELEVSSLETNPQTDIPADPVYQYLSIKSVKITSADATSIVVEFAVPTTWLDENNVKSSEISLYRYSDGEWHELATTVTGSDANFVRYKTTLPGFSSFAIAVSSSYQEPSDTEEDDTTTESSEVGAGDTEAGEDAPSVAETVEDEEPAPKSRKLGIIITIVLIVIIVGLSYLFYYARHSE